MVETAGVNPPMPSASTAAASRLLLDAWQQGRRIAALPEPLRPATRAEGYAIQAEVMALTSAPLFGWKIAATSTAGQQHIRVDGPLAGRLLAERVLPAGATVSIGHSLMACAEVEFAFRMGATLPPRDRPYATEEVLAAVDTLHPAIELPDSRYEDFTVVGAPQLIADDACADWFLLGDAAPERLAGAGPRGAPGDRDPQRRGRAARAGAATRWAIHAWRSRGWSTSCPAWASRSARARSSPPAPAWCPWRSAPGDEVRADLGVLGGRRSLPVRRITGARGAP